MGKKITEQNAGTSQEQDANGAAGGNGSTGSGQQLSVEELLEADADGVDGDAEGTDGDGEGDGTDSTDVAEIVRKAMEAFLPKITDQTTREIDRRVNSALKEVRQGAGKSKDEGDGNADGGDKAPRMASADVRGARIAFREYLPEQIRFLSPEEKALATEFGLTQINAAAAKGFDDEDEAGRQAAETTVAFLKKARSYYSGRTKKALEKQGAIRKDGTGQNSYGTTPPGSAQTAFDRAEKKNRELFPERYAHEKK